MVLKITSIFILAFQFVDSISLPNCGKSAKSRLSYHIIGGHQAGSNQYPWMVALVNENKNRAECSAFLIDEIHVMSAAHCFTPNQPSKFTARIGNIDWRRAEKFEIIDISTPSTYHHGQYYDDMVLLTLDRPAKGRHIIPICLPPDNPNDIRMDEYRIAGWGITRTDGSPENILRHLEKLPLSSKDECSTAFNNITGFEKLFPRGITDSMICAGFLEGGKDGCQGDSGGPLMGVKNGKFYAVGIQSFGNECAKPGFPAGYTRIADFKGFIENIQRIRTYHSYK